VDAFHAAELAAGGKDNGARDRDGHNVEAVCHLPE
jgi:hypothetical protein